MSTAPFRAIAACLLLLLFVDAGMAADRDCETPPRPVVMTLLAFTGMPDLAELGLSPVRIFGPQDLWPPGDPRTQVPSDEDLRSGLARRPPNGGPVVVDIEHWPLQGAQADATAWRLRRLLAGLRRAEPATAFGFYAAPPIRDYWRAIGQDGPQGLVAWQRENDRFLGLAAEVDVLFPSLYTFYDDVAGWRRYALSNLAEATRLANGKPVYPFLWPEFHPSNAQLGGRNLSGQFWREQLELVSRHATGIVLWGGWDAEGRRKPWDDEAEWWLETLRFLEERTLGRCDDLAGDG